MSQPDRDEPRRVLYRCPNQHRWWTNPSEAPLINIKCPNCGVTAFQLHEGQAAPQWQVEPLRTLEADEPPKPESREPSRREWIEELGRAMPDDEREPFPSDESKPE